jgi:hypothetical protein
MHGLVYFQVQVALYPDALRRRREHPGDGLASLAPPPGACVALLARTLAGDRGDELVGAIDRHGSLAASIRRCTSQWHPPSHEIAGFSANF